MPRRERRKRPHTLMGASSKAKGHPIVEKKERVKEGKGGRWRQRDCVIIKVN